MIRIAAVGSASAGKSAVLNATFGTAFQVDARARSTSVSEHVTTTFGDNPIEVIDSPSLEGGVVSADAYLFVCDKDLTESDYRELERIHQQRRPVAVLLNKADTYGETELFELIAHIRDRVNGLLPPHRVISCAADPIRMVHRIGADGTVVEHFEPAQPDVDNVRAVARELIAIAGGALRVRSRELSARTANKIANLWRDRAR